MKRNTGIAAALAMVVGTLLSALAGQASAQATRTWVSGVGDDANPCSRTAPCKTFAGAISKTAVDGEINCIDPGGFGAVTITKSIVIDCGGTYGSVLNAGTNGIIVNGGATVRVIVRNLSINGAGTGINGIHVLSAGNVKIENVAIRGQSGIGINFVPTVNSTMMVDRSSIRDNALHGIYAKPSAGMAARVFITKSKIAGNGGTGIHINDGAKAAVSDTVLLGNASNGATALSLSGGAAEIALERVVTAGNGSGGVGVSGPFAVVRMSDITAVNNSWGLMPAVNGGSLISFGNNHAAGNAAGNGSPTSTIAPF